MSSKIFNVYWLEFMAAQQIDRLVWIDIEMTGLDPFKHKIMEVAALVTDTELNILDENGFHRIIGITKEDASLMNEYVSEMHSENGLLEKSLASNVSVEQAEKELLSYLSGFVEPQKAPFCGNSMVTDRMFLKAYMKDLDQFLHYRNIDVSTLKQLYSMWADQPKFEKTVDNHTAFQDIINAIDEMKFYKERFLVSIK